MSNLSVCLTTIQDMEKKMLAELAKQNVCLGIPGNKSSFYNKISPSKLKQMLETEYTNPELFKFLSSIFTCIVSNGNEEVVNYLTGLHIIGEPSAEGYATFAGFREEQDLFVVKAPKKKETSMVLEAFTAIFGFNQLKKMIPSYAYVYGFFTCGTPNITTENDKPQITNWCSNNNENVQYVIYEKINGPSLAKALKKDNPQPMNIVDALTDLLALMNSIQYCGNEVDGTHYDLHTNNVMARDLPQDIPKTEDGRLWVPYPTTFEDHHIEVEVLEDNIPVKRIKMERHYNVEYIKLRHIPTIIDYGWSHIKYNNESFGRFNYDELGVLRCKSRPMYDVYKIVNAVVWTYIIRHMNEVEEVQEQQGKMFTCGELIEMAGKEGTGIHIELRLIMLLYFIRGDIYPNVLFAKLKSNKDDKSFTTLRDMVNTEREQNSFSAPLHKLINGGNIESNIKKDIDQFTPLDMVNYIKMHFSDVLQGNVSTEKPSIGVYECAQRCQNMSQIEETLGVPAQPPIIWSPQPRSSDFTGSPLKLGDSLINQQQTLDQGMQLSQLQTVGLSQPQPPQLFRTPTNFSEFVLGLNILMNYPQPLSPEEQEYNSNILYNALSYNNYQMELNLLNDFSDYLLNIQFIPYNFMPLMQRLQLDYQNFITNNNSNEQTFSEIVYSEVMPDIKQLVENYFNSYTDTKRIEDEFNKFMMYGFENVFTKQTLNVPPVINQAQNEIRISILSKHQEVQQRLDDLYGISNLIIQIINEQPELQNKFIINYLLNNIVAPLNV
jgi:hypothetical protein